MNAGRDVERLLSDWLDDEAPARAPDRILLMSHERVEQTSQRSRRLTRRSPTMITPMRFGMAAVIGVLVLGGAIYLSDVGTPDVGVTPNPTPTGSTQDYVAVGSQADGYQMLVPRMWQEVASGFPDARKWVGTDGSLMISYGTSIFEGGAVTMCGPPTPEWPLCGAQEFPSSIPYNPAIDGVAPLSIRDFVRDRCLRGCDVSVSDTTLGGEVAEQSSTTAAGQRVSYVSTFHDRRPIVVYWSEPVSSPAGTERIDRMRTSFEFLDAAVVSPTPFVDPTELVPYVNTEIGYEILVPRYWAEGTDHAGHAGVHEFGAGRGFGTGGDPALTISVGAPDGTVSVCQGFAHLCQTQVAATLGELDQLLVSVPASFEDAVSAETTGELVLASQPGRFKRPGYRLQSTATNDDGIGDITGGNCLGCPGMLYHAYTVKDGRPIVISIDYWTIAFQELSSDYLREILGSFRLTQ